MRADHPDLSVQSDAIVLSDGKYWTSGGVTAGMDLALELIECDLGPEIRRAVAGRLVLNAKRPGGQTQYIPAANVTVERGNRFASLHEWIEKNLGDDLSVERLANHVGMSPRNFARVYASAEEITPARAIELRRLRRARLLLEATHYSLKSVAQQCGFQSVDRLRKSFLRILGLTPSDYQARFGASAE